MKAWKRQLAIAAVGLAGTIDALSLTTTPVFACGGHAVSGWRTYPYSTSEWVGYCYQEGEAGEDGAASTNQCYSFKQDYYEEIGWYDAQEDCGNQWYYEYLEVTQSMVDVEDAKGNNGGIPFTVDSVQNGGQVWEYYHQRRNKTKDQQNRKDDGYWQGPVYDTQNDSYASGRLNQSSGYIGLWDGIYWGFVHTTSTASGVTGGRPVGLWGGIYVDYGH